MTATTDPRTVRTGTVQVSYTDKTKTDALIGRLAEHKLADGTKVRGRIERIEGVTPILRIIGGEYAGRTARLNRRVKLVG